jgi:outer membrane protein TolC
MIPVTPMATEQVVLDWQSLVATAQAQRPDLGQLKLAIQAAQQRLVLARNTALPRVDFVSVYRFNQLWGTSPTGADIDTTGDQFTDWTLGVNTTAPLGLRQARAELRRQELTLARDRANLQQGTHNALHQLATSYRRLVQYYEQYLAFRDTREAAELNLQQQMAEYQRGRAIFLEVLQAITAWGDAVRAEARSLAEYNLEKANLERETGMILEFHGVELLGQNYHSRGPLAPLNDGRGYPNSVHPDANKPRYPAGNQPAEKGFESPILPSSAPRR